MASRSTLKHLLRAPVYLYHWHLGPLLGHRFLLLTHVGRRTGRIHQTVLEVMEYRSAGPEAVVMSGFGRNADWLLNLEAGSSAQVEIGARHFVAQYRFLGHEEAMKVVQGYEQRNRFIAPILRYVLSRLLGWPYSGSETERRRLVAQLPLLGFRPQSS